MKRLIPFAISMLAVPLIGGDLHVLPLKCAPRCTAARGVTARIADTQKLGCRQAPLPFDSRLPLSGLGDMV